MTSKEKALKLCQDMAYTSMKTDFNEGYTLPLEIAKKCAKIAVEEILKSDKEATDHAFYIEHGIVFRTYWKEVKTEIEKL